MYFVSMSVYNLVPNIYVYNLIYYIKMTDPIYKINSQIFQETLLFCKILKLYLPLLSNSITFSKLSQLTDNYEVYVSLVVTIMCLIDTTMIVCIICICNLWRTLFGKNIYLTKIRFAATCDTL